MLDPANANLLGEPAHSVHLLYLPVVDGEEVDHNFEFLGQFGEVVDAEQVGCVVVEGQHDPAGQFDEVEGEFADSLPQTDFPLDGSVFEEEGADELPLAGDGAELVVAEQLVLVELVIDLVLEVLEGELVVVQDEGQHGRIEQDSAALLRLVHPLAVELSSLCRISRRLLQQRPALVQGQRLRLFRLGLPQRQELGWGFFGLVVGVGFGRHGLEL